MQLAANISTRSNKENVARTNANTMLYFCLFELFGCDCAPRFEPFDRKRSGHVKKNTTSHYAVSRHLNGSLCRTTRH